MQNFVDKRQWYPGDSSTCCHKYVSPAGYASLSFILFIFPSEYLAAFFPCPASNDTNCTIVQLKNRQKDWNRFFIKEDMQIAHEHIKILRIISHQGDES